MSPRLLFPILALVCATLTLAAAPAASPASVIILSNGDRLTGHVIKHADGKVYFHSDILGDIVAPESAVKIVEAPASAVPVESMVGLPPAKPAAPTAASIPSPEVKIVKKRRLTPVILAPPALPWAGKIEFGYDNIISNDVRTVAVVLRGEAERTIREDNLLFKGLFLYGSSGSVPTTDQEDVDFRWRHNLSDRLFTQADTSYDSDKIKLVHYEIEQSVGLGYKIVKTPRHTVDVGAGVTGQQLDATGVEKGFTYLGNVFQDYTYKINGRYTFREDASADYSPESRGLSGIVPDTTTLAGGSQRDYDYKFHSTLEGKINNHLSLNLHFDYQYDNAIVNPTTRVEQRITTTLGYGF